LTFSVDLFFSFRSPYSYLALPKTLKLVADYDATVNLRPVYPLAVRVPGFFKKTNPQFLPYVALDSSRVAQRENIPYRFPRPDPIVQDLATLEVAEHQPYIHRLTRLGALAQTEARALAFVNAIARVLWDGTVNGWNEGDHLARAAGEAGFDLSAMDAAISADPDRYQQVIASNGSYADIGISRKSRAQFSDFCSGLLRQAFPLSFTDASSVAKLGSFATVAFIPTNRTSYGSIERSVGSGSAPAAVSIAWICPRWWVWWLKSSIAQRAFGFSIRVEPSPGYQTIIPLRSASSNRAAHSSISSSRCKRSVLKSSQPDGLVRECLMVSSGRSFPFNRCSIRASAQ